MALSIATRDDASSAALRSAGRGIRICDCFAQKVEVKATDSSACGPQNDSMRDPSRIVILSEAKNPPIRHLCTNAPGKGDGFLRLRAL